MGKRKHGTASTPMGFSTRNYEMLRAKKVAGENISDYIDKAIEHYDGTINWKARGMDEWEVKSLQFRRDLESVKEYIRWSLRGPPRDAWKMWLTDQLSLVGEEE